MNDKEILERAEKLVAELSAGRTAGNAVRKAVVAAKGVRRKVGDTAKKMYGHSLTNKMSHHQIMAYASKDPATKATHAASYHAAAAARKGLNRSSALSHYGKKAAVVGAVAAGAYAVHKASKKRQQSQSYESIGENTVADKKIIKHPLQQELEAFHRQAGLPPPGPKAPLPKKNEEVDETNLMHGMNAVRSAALQHGKVISKVGNAVTIAHQGKQHIFHASVLKHIGQAAGQAVKKA